MSDLPISDSHLYEDNGLSDNPVGEKRKAYWVAGAFFVVFLGAAALIPLDSGAVGTGTVVVTGNRQAVQHRDGGVVAELHVKEGQSVKKGQILLTIAAVDIAAAERGLTAETLSLLAQKQRLYAERDKSQRVINPPEFAFLPETDKPLAIAALEAQRRLFAARQTSTGAQQGVLQQRSRQIQEQIKGFEQQIISNREQARLLAEEIAGMKELEERGFASKNRIRGLERAAAELDGQSGSLTAQIARARESMGEVSMQSLSVESGLLQDVSEQLREVNSRLDEIRPRLTSVREQLLRAQVRAPSSGKIVGLKVFTVGGVVAGGELLMEIVPQDRELVINAQLAPRDADDLSVGPEAQVRFTGIQERSVPVLVGKISSVSADSFSDERSGIPYFTAQIRIPASELEKVQSIRPGRSIIQPGLPVDIVFPIRKRTALSYLLEPLTQSLWLAGREN